MSWIAELLDGIALLGALIAAVVFVIGAPSAGTDIGLAAISGVAAVIAVAPHCLASAVHRSVTRNQMRRDAKTRAAKTE